MDTKELQGPLDTAGEAVRQACDMHEILQLTEEEAIGLVQAYTGWGRQQCREFAVKHLGQYPQPNSTSSELTPVVDLGTVVWDPPPYQLGRLNAALATLNLPPAEPTQEAKKRKGGRPVTVIPHEVLVRAMAWLSYEGDLDNLAAIKTKLEELLLSEGLDASDSTIARWARKIRDAYLDAGRS